MAVLCCYRERITDQIGPSKMSRLNFRNKFSGAFRFVSNVLFIAILASRDSDRVLGPVIEVFSLVFQLPQIHDGTIQRRL